MFLRLKDGNRQAEFERKLDNFKVLLTHAGNSYYAFEGKVYMINTERQVVSHSFHRKADGHPSNTNEVYEKLLEGDLLLSPYATWTFQILSSSTSAFDELKEFRSIGVDLLLVGFGKYVIQEFRGTRIPFLNLDHYYQQRANWTDMNMN